MAEGKITTVAADLLPDVLPVNTSTQYSFCSSDQIRVDGSEHRPATHVIIWYILDTAPVTSVHPPLWWQRQLDFRVGAANATQSSTSSFTSLGYRPGNHAGIKSRYSSRVTGCLLRSAPSANTPLKNVKWRVTASAAAFKSCQTPRSCKIHV